METLSAVGLYSKLLLQPVTDTARWTREWMTGESSDKIATESKYWYTVRYRVSTKFY